jgi:O-antigen/teichoic acid export membrane protein
VPLDVQGIDSKHLKLFTIILSFPIAMSVYFFTPTVFSSMFTQYYDSIRILQIVSFSIIPVTISYVISIKLTAKEKNFPIIVSAYLGLFTQVLGIVALGNIYGIEGVAWSFLISRCIGGFSLVAFSRIRKLTF